MSTDNNDWHRDGAALGAPPGLCRGCRHALLRPTRKGTVYLRCAAADSDAFDPPLPRYPALPVLSCPAFGPQHPEAPERADPPDAPLK